MRGFIAYGNRQVLHELAAFLEHNFSVVGELLRLSNDQWLQSFYHRVCLERSLVVLGNWILLAENALRPASQRPELVRRASTPLSGVISLALVVLPCPLAVVLPTSSYSRELELLSNDCSWLDFFSFA